MAPENEPLSALAHLLGFLLATAGLVLLVVFAAERATVWHVVGFSVYGTSAMLLYLASTLYHWLPLTHRAKTVLQRVDHAAIFVLIAGTYTPITLTSPNRGWGWSMFGVIWGLAAVGIIIKIANIHLNKWYAALPYLIMGWLVVIAFNPLVGSIPGAGRWWLLAGGVLYTVGTLFFALDYFRPRARWFGYHEIWHLFVLGASFCHFWTMLRYVLYL